MKTTIGLSAVAGAMLFATSAFALPGASTPGGPPSDNGLVTQVAQGCGPGGWRGPYGRCNYGGAPRYYRPPVRCWMQPTPYGPRRVCR